MTFATVTFNYVWVFTRLDGKEFTSEDSESCCGRMRRKWSIGSAWTTRRLTLPDRIFRIEPENLAALQKRYKIEDYSEK